VVAFPPEAPPAELLSRPTGHVYSLFLIRCSITCVTSTCTSYRGVALFLALWASLTPGLASPCAETIRLWLLRVGLYLLRRPTPVCSAWALLIDLTIQLGQHKCLVVLGVALPELRGPACALDHHSVHVLAVQVLTRCTGEVIHEQLECVARRVGVPKQIVSDHGSDVERGVGLFQAEHPEVVATYDVTHQLACRLKAELEPDERWQEFVRGCQQTRQQLQQTAGSFLLPPAWRTKARYLNLAGHLRWGADLLPLLDGAGQEALAEQLGCSVAAGQQWLEDKVGWLRGFRREIGSWGYLQQVVLQTEEVIKTGGLSSSSVGEVRRRLLPKACPDARGERFRRDVLAAVAEQAKAIPKGQRYVGSTDVLESLFGKYKEVAARSPLSEVGASVLALPVFTAELTPELVKQALEQVSVSDVQEWLEREIGVSARQKKQAVMAAAGEELAEGKGDTKVA
jgi:hypothetical protein